MRESYVGTFTATLEITTTLSSLLTRQSEFSQLLKIMKFKGHYEREADILVQSMTSYYSEIID